jgi:hypothetical protein
MTNAQCLLGFIGKVAAAGGDVAALLNEMVHGDALKHRAAVLPDAPEVSLGATGKVSTALQGKAPVPHCTSAPSQSVPKPAVMSPATCQSPATTSQGPAQAKGSFHGDNRNITAQMPRSPESPKSADRNRSTDIVRLTEEGMKWATEGVAVRVAGGHADIQRLYLNLRDFGDTDGIGRTTRVDLNAFLVAVHRGGGNIAPLRKALADGTISRDGPVPQE